MQIDELQIYSPILKITLIVDAAIHITYKFFWQISFFNSLTITTNQCFFRNFLGHFLDKEKWGNYWVSSENLTRLPIFL